MDINWALEQIKTPNKKATRVSWVKDNKFIWLIPEAMVKKEWVKDELLLGIFGDKTEMKMPSFIRSYDDTNGVITGWTPSLEDFTATDWVTV